MKRRERIRKTLNKIKGTRNERKKVYWYWV
jgi:hypothetical protein